MAFTPIQGDSGKYVEIGAATGVTFVKGNAVKDSSGAGYITNAAAGDNTPVHFVVMESKTTTANGEKVLCVKVEGVTFLADCDAAWSVTDVLTEADLAAAGQVDPDASTDDIFFIERGVGIAETGTQVIGHFLHGDPQA
ncbi:MAG: hypothetical protein ABIJ40_09485 [Bacteroidota bacterium]